MGESRDDTRTSSCRRRIMFWLIWIRISSRLRDHPPLYRDSNDGNWCLSSSLLLLITTAVVYLSGHHHMLSRHTLTMHSLPRTMQSTRRMHRSARSGNLWAKTQQPSGTQIPLLPKEHLFLMLFLQSKNDHSRVERPTTSRSSKTSPPNSVSPISGHFPLPTTPVSRNDSGFALTATLREKRSGHFDGTSRRSSSFGVDRQPTLRRPSIPFSNGHSSSLSTSALSIDAKSTYGYAPSTYAASTLAASTIMPNMLMQPVRNTDTMVWVEGHCFVWQRNDTASVCSICDDKPEGDGIYKCNSCSTVSHGRCLGHVSLVCPSAFHPDRVRASFVRCFSSLFYTYRKYLNRPTKEQKSSGQLYGFDMDGFMKSLPHEQQEYTAMLKQTQAFNEFIHERETTSPSSPSIQLFDSIILAKKSRGRTSFFSKGSKSSSFLEDTSEHLWRSAAVPTPSAKFPGDYRSVVSRIPAQLDVALMREPRVIQGVPRMDMPGKRVGRKAVPSLLR